MKHTYITRAILKDYLTIKNVDITFNEGVNIIIGKNGTGKTNFVNYLADSIQANPQMSNNDSSIYFMFEGVEYLKEVFKSNFFIDNEKKINEAKEPKIKVYKDGVELENKAFIGFINVTKIIHGIPKQYLIVDEPINDLVRKNENSISIFPKIQIIERNRIANIIGLNYLREVLMSDIQSEYTINDFLNIVREYLSSYSNIKDIRQGNNSRVDRVAVNEARFINLYLEYFVNDEWLLFNQLSDGTKRLFYVISEIVYSQYPIILLEEPELGIHPHQLYDLMRFIKEMSEKFQFIITTHSPMVLNTLNSDELGNIIISKFENGETKLEHLTTEQIEKAKVFMQEEADLSDYWIHSDLEY